MLQSTATMMLALMLSGCSHAPSISIVGSFFPVWMICLIAGIFAAAFARTSLLRRQLEDHVAPLWLFYPSVVVLTACAVWLIFYR
ncbi:YtcA family lipoprotein [Granulicella cerasi]|uniref:Uncharacterized protein YtcA n=2 Tax=Granulicella cerasi TaxID=741063 RepID=A0ABW1ZCV4_9BACT